MISRETRAIRGAIANPAAGLLLPFHWNPTLVEVEKETRYDVDTPIGHNAPIATWVSGGVKRIRFDVLFMYSDGIVDSNVMVFQLPHFGAKGVIAIIESFLEPQSGFVKQQIGGFGSYKPPPLCYLLLGLRFWKTRLVAAPWQEQSHDVVLTPTRVLFNLEFLILEEGTLNNVNQVVRRLSALAETTIGAASTAITMF